MKLTEIIQPEAVVPQLTSTDRDGVLAELVDALVASGACQGEHRREIVKLLQERERRSTTGFGAGIAVPHAKHPSVTRVAAAVGLSPSGLDFASLDMQPVYSVFLLLSPPEKPDDHLHAMEVIFKVLSQESFRRLLRQSASQQDVMTLLEDNDNQQL